MKVIGEYLREIVADLTQGDILKALREQTARADRGEHVPLGEILLEWGLISRDELNLALERQACAGRTLFVPRSHPGQESVYH